MKKQLVLSSLATAFLGLTGCFGFLKPARVNTRYFVLAPLPAATAPATPTPLGVGVGFVKIPGSLFNTAMAVRRGTNELSYLETDLWAQRLDQGLQEVLAANLGTLLPTDRVRLSTWRPDEVNVEVFVTVTQFDVDDQGLGTLVAWWRILTPGGGSTLKTGQFKATRSGPAPESDPDGATATMSELAADLSRDIALAIKAAGH